MKMSLLSLRSARNANRAAGKPACSPHAAAWAALLSHPALAAPAAAPSAGRAFRHGLLWTVVILIILAVALIAIRRFTHRFRQFLAVRRRRTEVVDAWSQHRLPEDWKEGTHVEYDDPEPDDLDDHEDNRDNEG